jgi:hypothetical protein
MYNGREHTSSLVPSHYLEMTIDISYTICYLLQPSLAINGNQLKLVGNYVAKGRHVVQMEKMHSLIFMIS